MPVQSSGGWRSMQIIAVANNLVREIAERGCDCNFDTLSIVTFQKYVFFFFN